MAAAKPVREVIKYGDGTTKAQGQRLNNEMHGAWKFFRLDGSLMRSGTLIVAAKLACGRPTRATARW